MSQTRQFGRCIIIDDDPDILLSARLLLRDMFREVADFRSPEAAMAAIEEEAPDVILLDANFGRGATDAAEGLHWLSQILARDPQAVVVMITHCYYGYTASGGPVGVGQAVGRSMRFSLVSVVLVVLLAQLALYGVDPNFNLTV